MEEGKEERKKGKREDTIPVIPIPIVKTT